jgi:hypothetical protein
MDETDAFLGSWELVPELSLYEVGPTPASGRYEIAAVGADELELSIGWTLEAGGPEHSTTFGGPPDGRAVPLAGAAEAGPGPDAFTLTRVDRRTLDSAALRAGTVVAFARRVASHDGRLLAVVQEGQRPDGTRFRNFQVYRRLGSDDPLD